MAFNIDGLGKVGNLSRRGASPQILLSYNDTLATQYLATITSTKIASMLEVGDEN